MSHISIQNAREGNLKGVSLDVPKGRLVAFTGLSGSGKSTLLVDVLFNECQRRCCAGCRLSDLSAVYLPVSAA